MLKKYFPFIIIVSFILILLIILLNQDKETSNKNTTVENLTDSEQVIDTLSLFIETSGSMLGYTSAIETGNFQFLSIIPNIITDLNKLKTDSIIKDLRIYKINDRPSPQIDNRDRERIIRDILDGSMFNGGTSELQNTLSNLIKTTKNNQINLLITDCILYFSNRNISGYGPIFSSNIYNSLSENDNISIAVFQYLTDFNAYHYFNRINQRFTTNKNQRLILKKRPFYIIVIGKSQNISKLIEKEIFKNHDNSYVFGFNYSKVKNKIFTSLSQGYISNIDDSNNIITLEKKITKNDPESKIELIFGLNLNELPGFARDNQYLKNNLEIDRDKSTWQIDVLDKDYLKRLKGYEKVSSELSEKYYTNYLRVTFTDYDEKDTNLKLILKIREPDWVKRTYLADDLNITSDSLEYKTFSFNFIIDGFNRRFKKDSILFKIPFKIIEEK
jgi:hypothetical protein